MESNKNLFAEVFPELIDGDNHIIRREYYRLLRRKIVYKEDKLLDDFIRKTKNV